MDIISICHANSSVPFPLLNILFPLPVSVTLSSQKQIFIQLPANQRLPELVPSLHCFGLTPNDKLL